MINNDLLQTQGKIFYFITIQKKLDELQKLSIFHDT